MINIIYIYLLTAELPDTTLLLKLSVPPDIENPPPFKYVYIMLDWINYKSAYKEEKIIE